MTQDVILSVKDLTVNFTTDDGPREVLHGVSFEVKAGRTLGLVGESGSGKSVTAMSIMGLLPKPYGQVTGGEILYRGTDLVTLPAKERYAMRGNRISIIFQDPMTALNPVHTIGRQINEVLMLHRAELDKKSPLCLRLGYDEQGKKFRYPKNVLMNIRITCLAGCVSG